MTAREIGERIRSTAKGKGVSLTFLCEQIGVNKGYFKDLCNDRGKITDERIEQIAQIIGVTSEYLRGETDEKNKPTPVVESEPKDNNDINLLVQFYKGFSEEQRKELVAEAFRIWQKEQNSN